MAQQRIAIAMNPLFDHNQPRHPRLTTRDSDAHDYFDTGCDVDVDVHFADPKSKQTNNAHQEVHSIAQKYQVPYKEDQYNRMCLKHALNALFQESGKFTKSDLDGICKDISPNKGKILKRNPHKSVFGTGKYDANVLETALKREGVDYEWLKDDADFDRTVFNGKFLCDDKESKFLGFILNVEVPMVEMEDTLNVNVPKLKSIQKRVPSRRHWKTIKRINWNETQHRIVDDEKKQQLMGRKKRANAIKSLDNVPKPKPMANREFWYDLDSMLKDPVKMSEEAVRHCLFKVLKVDGGRVLVCRQKVTKKPLPPMPEMDDAEQKMDELDLLERMCTFGVNLQGEVWRQQDLMNEVVEEIINDENPQLIK